MVGLAPIRYTWDVLELVITHLTGSRRNAVETFGSLPLRLGRADDNDVKFDADKELKVSAHHAEIRSDGAGGLVVVDLSKNGVLVNGARIEGEAALPNHAVVELGGADGPRLRIKYEASSGGISFSKLKKAAAATGEPPANKHLRTTAEAEAYTESDLEPTAPPKPPAAPGSKVGLVIAVVVLLAAVGVLGAILLR